MAQDLETRLKGTLRGHVTLEFLTNSVHFPITNIFLEMVLEGPGFFFKPDFYTIIISALLQSFFLGRWQYIAKPRPFWGNMIGPALYSTVETAIEGADFFSGANHVAYILFSFTIGLLQELKLHTRDKVRNAIIFLENLIRTTILLVMYWIFEVLSDPQYAVFDVFMQDRSHLFIILSIVFIGIMIGLANITAQSYLSILHETATHLRQYSEWLLGKNLLSAAVTDPAALSLQRRERAVLFMDIRGFTGWSEMQPPEEVVSMLNASFEKAEMIWAKYDAIKSKFSGDEVMIVFSEEKNAAYAGLELLRDIGEFLKEYRLSVGIGIHSGTLVEGLIGSKKVKGYDVIGDTVNTAKRLCDEAAGDEMLISQNVYDVIKDCAIILNPRQILLKGKNEMIDVYSLHGIRTDESIFTAQGG